MAIESLPKLNFSVPFAMTSALPLDWNTLFDSYEDAVSAAATAEAAGSSATVYYYGQEIVVVESGVATLYVIQPDKSLAPVGSAPIEAININGAPLAISGQTVDIPIATASQLGVVLSSTGENKVTVAENGTMSVTQVNVNTLVQTEGETLILNGGNSTFSNAG